MRHRAGRAARTDGAVVEAVGLTRDFRGVRAVDGLDLTVQRGEIYGCLGRNGAGKSTTIHMLTTLLRPSSGTARVTGFDVVRQRQQARLAIGVAMQEVALDPVLTAWDHVHLQGALHGIGRQQRLRRGESLLGVLGVLDVAGRKVATYSGGVKRRLDLALALLHEPDVVFLDEPTNGLDIGSREALWSTVRELARGGTTIFLTTQYLEEADVLADRVGIIDRGRLVVEATPAELKLRLGQPVVECLPARQEDHGIVQSLLARFGPPAVPVRPRACAVRVPTSSALVEVVRTLDLQHVDVVHVEVREPSLSDVFLAITGQADAERDGLAA